MSRSPLHTDAGPRIGSELCWRHRRGIAAATTATTATTAGALVGAAHRHGLRWHAGVYATKQTAKLWSRAEAVAYIEERHRCNIAAAAGR